MRIVAELRVGQRGRGADAHEPAVLKDADVSVVLDLQRGEWKSSTFQGGKLSVLHQGTDRGFAFFSKPPCSFVQPELQCLKV